MGEISVFATICPRTGKRVWPITILAHYNIVSPFFVLCVVDVPPNNHITALGLPLDRYDRDAS